MPRIKAWKNRLTLSAYESAPLSTLQIIDNKSRELVGEPISIPVPIMYRMYHLGRAYDFQTMKVLMPDGKKVFDWHNLQQLKTEIENLGDVVIDPVISHYSNQLLASLNETVSRTSCGLVYVSP